VQFAATLRGWVTLFYYIDKHIDKAEAQAAGIIAKILTNLLCEKMQRVTGRTSREPFVNLFFFGSNVHIL